MTFEMFGRWCSQHPGNRNDSGDPRTGMTQLVDTMTPSTETAKPLASRRDLTGYMMALCGQIGADSYMLAAVLHERDKSNVRIVASNWIYDAIQIVGHRVIAAIAQCDHTAPPGAQPQPITTSQAPAMPSVLSGEDAKLLGVLGHDEIFALRLNVGRQRLFLLLSAERAEKIDVSELTRAQMRCCYALSHVPDLLAASALQDPLSDRERECLYWVSEGKTTEDVAMILGVSSNTVNSYLTHTIQKFGASNRAMAVATAIRSGII